MLLFSSQFHEGITSGRITLTYRTWPKCKVKNGGRYRCHPLGVLLVSDVSRVKLQDVPDADARASGFESAAALGAYLKGFGATEDGEVWRVAFAHVGDGDRSDAALDDNLSADDVAKLRDKLAKMDARAEKPFVAETLEIITRRPRIAASRLAKELGRETAPFKADVVKLKKLGLTQSFEVGYEVSPRGVAYLRAVGGA